MIYLNIFLGYPKYSTPLSNQESSGPNKEKKTTNNDIVAVVSLKSGSREPLQRLRHDDYPMALGYYTITCQAPQLLPIEQKEYTTCKMHCQSCLLDLQAS
jgi:hypothetical protein